MPVAAIDYTVNAKADLMSTSRSFADPLNPSGDGSAYYADAAELPAEALSAPVSAETPPVDPTDDPDAAEAAESRTAARNANARRGKANGDRGKRAERALVAWLRAHGWPGAERTVRTGHRTRQRVSVDKGDVDGTPGVCWQLKDVADAALHRVPVWLNETERQRMAAGADLGVLVVKRRGHSDPGDWWAWVPLVTLMHGVMTPAAASGIGAARMFTVPVRLAVADLAPILRHQGYGTPFDGDAA
jgi:hypothetical protein